MKSILLILFTICGVTFSQSDSIKSVVITTRDIQNINVSGQHLKSASEYMFVCVGGALIGGGLSAGGFATNNQVLGYIGIGIGCISAIVAIIPPILIGKSGNMLLKIGQ